MAEPDETNPMTSLKTNLPEQAGEFQIVQVEMDANLYLWFGRYGHALCLASLLEKEGNRFGLFKEYDKRPFKWVSDRFAKPEELTDILTYETVRDLADPDIPDLEKPEIPALEGPGYRVIGMGRARIDVGKKTIGFYGSSMSYNIGINTEQLTLAERLKLDWKISIS
ncbi:MAG: hypothetical protein AABX70_03100 [Nanoarchaeota archaeon]